ncbi:MAG: hypothetical protein H7Y22_06645 [Gemmatimonadaceae bacterium]|nr:hypothetical protein [Gloeobacterales cyanobacterium ES-bin-141]
MRAATPASRSASSENTFAPQARQWVKLRDRLCDYSDDQALLLCEEDGRWVVWVPDHGVAVLEREQLLKSL